MKLYLYALTAHVGAGVRTVGGQTHPRQVRVERLYGQLTQHDICPNCAASAGRRRRLVRVERRALLGSRGQLTAALRAWGEAGTIQSFSRLRQAPHRRAAARPTMITQQDGEKHGYGIMLEVEAITEGQTPMGPGTLYGAIKRLLPAGHIGK